MKKITSKNETGFIGELVIKTFKDGKLIRQSEPIRNKVVSGSGGYGRNIVARQLAGDTTYGIEIDSASIGDDNTPVVDSDTNLGNAIETGIPLTNITVANNVVSIDVFLADANLPDDTYEEFGFFCNSRLFSRLIISPAYVKVTGEDTLFTYTLTLTG